ncbi:hypothetical protein GCM10009127_28920 [Alteraurantiacibacter aestuarii]|uniref:Uncharacterized protein n=1 Tax=Alteraurantiacibacter aestuarii TaxID=650004 RepID=A0A844ZNT8_9SPHN|nr:hypothetical protein [Alteraurantiacibacter aestuarii]MXO89002.1 hypothetical protein [Alteraurantiacibacter aestuarii]
MKRIILLPAMLSLASAAAAQDFEPADIEARMAAASQAQQRAALIAEQLSAPDSSQQMQPAQIEAIAEIREYIAAQPDDACDAVAFQPVVLPQEADGRTPVYLVNTSGKERSFALGENFRVMIGPNDEIGPVEPLTQGCETIEWDPDNPELGLSVFVTRYDMGRNPSEIHFLASSRLPMSMGVITGDLIWPMAGGFTAGPVPAAEAGY